MSATVFIGLGANLGDPAAQLAEALCRLGGAGTVRAVSGGYRTTPVGGGPQPEFLNAVCVLETSLPPEALLDYTQGVEREMGRVRTTRHGPRVIDLDLLDYGGAQYRSDRLTLPHAEMAGRAFVLVPLAEAAPGWRHPVSGRTARELLAAVPPGETVVRVVELDPDGARGAAAEDSPGQGSCSESR